MPNKIAPVLAVDPYYIYVNCPFCDKVHVHPSDGDITQNNYETRTSHCRKIERGIYELVCDAWTVRRASGLSMEWVEKTFGRIV